MEKTNSSNQPKSISFLVASPQDLRMIADRMEAEAKNTLPGQEVFYELSKSTVLFWNPEVSASARALVGNSNSSGVITVLTNDYEGAPV